MLRWEQGSLVVSKGKALLSVLLILLASVILFVYHEG